MPVIVVLLNLFTALYRMQQEAERERKAGSDGSGDGGENGPAARAKKEELR